MAIISSLNLYFRSSHHLHSFNQLMLWSILKVIFLSVLSLQFIFVFCFFFIVCRSSRQSGFFFRMRVFPVLTLLVLEIMLSLPIYCRFWIFLFCPWDKIYTATGDRRFWETSDVEFCWSFCLAFVNHEACLVFHCYEAYCRLQPCRLSDTKTLPTPGLPCFYSHGWLTQTCPAI